MSSNWIGFTLGLLLLGCADGRGGLDQWAEDEDPLQLRDVVTWDEYRDAARVQVGDKTAYLVEWDLWLETEDALRDYYEASVNEPVEKAHAFAQVSSGNALRRDLLKALHIRYCISTVFPNHADVIAHMASATASWEAVANVNFDYVPSADSNCVAGNSAVDLAVISNTWEFASLGCAAPTLDNWVGTPNTKFACPDQNFNMQRGTLVLNYPKINAEVAMFELTEAGVIRHELGHSFGLQHEHIWANQITGPNCAVDPRADFAEDYTGRPLVSVAFDIESVMHYPWCNGSVDRDLTISAVDGASMRVLYGMPVAWYVAAGII